MTELLDRNRHPSRREVVALGVGALVAWTRGGALTHRRSQLVRRSLPVMGTVGEIHAVHRDARLASRAIDAAFAELNRVERLMTRFTDWSDIGRANRAPGDVVPISTDTAYVVATALEWADRTDGRFDPCLGRLVELWDVSHRAVPPPPEAFGRLAGLGLYRDVDIDRYRDASVLRIRNDDAQIDLGGIAKGYGIDCAVNALRQCGITDGLVNVGGDLYALGRSPDGDTWQIGIRSPEDPGRLIGRVPVTDAAVATSGDYEQFFDYGSTRYHHLLDPKTGAPRRANQHSVTVTAPRCMEADAAATTAFGMSPQEARALLVRCNRDVELVTPV